MVNGTIQSPAGMIENNETKSPINMFVWNIDRLIRLPKVGIEQFPPTF